MTELMKQTPADVIWSPCEAMACALCWAGFSEPQMTMPEDTPEKYWCRMPPVTRNLYRRMAREMLLLAVAKGAAVALLPSGEWTPEQQTLVGQHAGLISPWRIANAIDAVYQARRDLTRIDLPIVERRE